MGTHIWGRPREIWFCFFLLFYGLKLILNCKKKAYFYTKKYAHFYDVLRIAGTSLGLGPGLCGVGRSGGGCVSVHRLLDKVCELLARRGKCSVRRLKFAPWVDVGNFSRIQLRITKDVWAVPRECFGRTTGDHWLASRAACG